ncbi:fungal-specific transcription factor domain-containing protein [Aspergillus keveii]|uniref:Fungal-specific transcription factor domain-containing protein n=1 Tax=Aspergillus keveii TaxID=714993 RepID=A0ABR4G8A7_9EURO
MASTNHATSQQPPDCNENSRLGHGTKPRSKAKYAQRACTECQRRRIRCQGGPPCVRCEFRGVPCVVRDRPYRAFKGRKPRKTTHVEESQTVPSAVEGESHTNFVTDAPITPATWDPADAALDSIMDGPFTYQDEMLSSGFPSMMTADDWAMLDAGSLILFSGDFADTDLYAQDMHSPITPITPTLPPCPLGKTPQSSIVADGLRQSSFYSLMQEDGILPAKAECDVLLEQFFSLVHILDPFLHEPSIWEGYQKLWAQGPVSPPGGHKTRPDGGLLTAVVLLCLANTECYPPCRPNIPEPGRVLCDAALQLLRPVLDPCGNHPVSLEGIQALVLLALYYLRRGRNTPAQRILAQAITCVHSIGLHQEALYKDLPLFEAQMYRRVWWEIFALDRRISLETGMPYVIQPSNVTTEHPGDLSDQWLEEQRTLAVVSPGFRETNRQTSSSTHTNVAYLRAMIPYAEVIGHAWQALHGTPTRQRQPHQAPGVQMDTMIDTAQKRIPHSLVYDPSLPFYEQFPSRNRAQIIQATLLHMRYLFLRLRIRLPNFFSFSQRGNLFKCDESKCLQLAATTIKQFANIPPEYGLPIARYLINAIAVIANQGLRDFDVQKSYHGVLNMAIQTLNAYREHGE